MREVTFWNINFAKVNSPSCYDCLCGSHSFSHFLISSFSNSEIYAQPTFINIKKQMANFVQLQNLPFVPVYNQNVHLLALQYPKTKSSIKTKKTLYIVFPILISVSLSLGKKCFTLTSFRVSVGLL